MRLLFIAVLFVALLVMAPAAEAKWSWQDPVEFVVAEPRVGDHLRFDRYSHEPGEEAVSGVRYLLIEPGRTVADKYGIPRATDVFLLSTFDEANGTTTPRQRCHLLEGGDEPVRVDLLDDGWGGRWGSWGAETALGGVVLRETKTDYEARITTIFDWCEMHRMQLGGATLREGDAVPFSHLVPNVADELADDASAAAMASSFHGRDALTFRYDLRALFEEEFGDEDVEMVEAWADIVVAEGIPHFARIEAHVMMRADGEEMTFRHREEITGFVRGEGPALAPMTGARLPQTHPTATWMDYERFHVPDEAFDLPFTFREAFDAAMREPTSELRGWLATHPEAALVDAAYTRGGGHRVVDAGRPDGSWVFAIADARDSIHVFSSRSGRDVVPEPLGGFTRPLHPTETTTRQISESFRSPESFPDMLLDSQSIVAMAEAHGIVSKDVKTLTFSYRSYGGEPYAYLYLSEVDESERASGSESGRGIAMELVRLSVWALMTSERTSSQKGLLHPFPDAGALDDDADGVSALALLAGPGVGVGLGVGAATGVALLVILAKFVAVPLFTRLLRDRLLDNPVRARLYEQVRAEPGIHQAQLVEFLGVGAGATRHHLAQLKRHHMVTELIDGGHVRYYATGEVPPALVRQAAALRGESAQRVHDLLRQEPQLSLREAAARLDMSAPNVYRLKKKLEKAGLLEAGAVA